MHSIIVLIFILVCNIFSVIISEDINIEKVFHGEKEFVAAAQGHSSNQPTTDKVIGHEYQKMYV